jgi:hypothetical protein
LGSNSVIAPPSAGFFIGPKTRVFWEFLALLIVTRVYLPLHLRSFVLASESALNGYFSDQFRLSLD